ncbi:MAG: hypothetical protein IPJ27_15705 [Candidatus Accumulibacter sp.]|uniref:Uncharacterized protein n=1 Tax=Candidatus Accumulibacter proximus TaxID=2954385 RepID=A0A935UGH4_9PROT|nr:hypothetical protein [Candidatus Accumulibacter proximus]
MAAGRNCPRSRRPIRGTPTAIAGVISPLAARVVRGGASWDLGDGTLAGVTLNYDHRDYSFSNSGASQ